MSGAEWVAVSASPVGGPAWATVASVTTTVDEGVDFRLTLREQYPWRLSASRPLPISVLLPEGEP